MYKVYFKSSKSMKEMDNESVDLIITSPPYFNIKDYSMNGTQDKVHSEVNKNDVGSYHEYYKYINEMLKIWKECYRVLKPNGKMCINVPLMPILKSKMNTHHNRHIFDIQSDIQNSVIKKTKFELLDLYIWNRTNSTKKLMFGSYPYPSNLYAQNTTEFITVYVKDGKPLIKSNKNKILSKLTKEEWIQYTKQIWDIPIPNKGDIGFGKHAAIMPEEIVKRLTKMFSIVGDVVLDPFCGSGTTLKVAYENGRNCVGYELYKNYEEVIYKKRTIAEKNIPKKLKGFVKDE